MRPSYDDILSQIATPPLWYDEMAVPRYCTFAPKRAANPYCREIVLAEIRCQHCRKKWFIAISGMNHGGYSIAREINTKQLCFGDPPMHSENQEIGVTCSAGYSMQTITMRVLEYWLLNMEDHKWYRDPTLEIDIDADYWD